MTLFTFQTTDIFQLLYCENTNLLLEAEGTLKNLGAAVMIHSIN